MTPSETEIEIRIAYLCNRAATGTLTLEEECELLEYIALEPHIVEQLVPEEFEVWLNPDNTDIGALQDLIRPAPDDAITFKPVSKRVNNPANQGAWLIERVSL